MRNIKSGWFTILILGYKDVGRGIEYHYSDREIIHGNQQWLYDNLPDITQMFKIVSFDNLALEQLDVKRLLTEAEWEEFYGGDDGTFTFFINLVDGYFARNSLSNIHYPIEDKSIDEMFEIIKVDDKSNVDLVDFTHLHNKLAVDVVIDTENKNSQI